MIKLNKKILNLNEYLAKPNKSIEEHTVELLEELEILKNIGYIKNARIYELSKKACELHDLGKVNDSFQKRVKSNDSKKIKFNEENEVSHNVLSLCFIDKQEFKDEQDYLCVAYAVLNHHYYGDYPIEILNKKRELINKLISKFTCAKFPGPRERSALVKSSTVENNDNILVKGFLHKCDYSASAGYTVEYRNNFLLKSMDGIRNRLSYKWNSLQEFCIKNTDNNIIITAPTGMGKTEAGLLWQGDNKSFFILPIRTAINAMYDRIRENILLNENINERLAILHSSSIEYYVKNKDGLNGKEDEEINLVEYENKGKNLSLPLNVSTMDQIFDFVFKYQGYELKLATLSYSKIVIDEIQMYGADLLAYLICGIEKIIELGGKVAILTATLPPFIYDLLNEEKNLFIRKSFEEADDGKARHNIKVKEYELNSSDIYNLYMENKQSLKSNKILVVCNSVKKAQQIYAELKNIESENYIQENDIINILHSSFIRKDRNLKEKEILDFGQTYRINENNEKEIDKQSGIWITTSLVEASLDIDFDYLFTELQDLSSLFQRLGRCNRKGEKDCTYSNSFIYTEIDKSLFINEDKGFIDKGIYEVSKEAILTVNGIISEIQKVKLINDYLTTDKLKKCGYLVKYREIYSFIKKLEPYSIDRENVKLRNILNESIIPSPIYEKNKYEINYFLEKLNNCVIKIKEYNLKSSKTELSNDDMLELNQLKNEKIQSRQKIYDFTVDIANYKIYKKNNVKNGLKYNDLVISDYEKIKVFECEYDDMGFREIDYENFIRKADFL